MFAAVPFGPERSEFHGPDGITAAARGDLGDRQAKYKIVACRAASSAGSVRSFRKEVKDHDDLKGLKMRFFGLGANVIQKLGVRHSCCKPAKSSRPCSSAPSTPPSSRCRSRSEPRFHQVAKHYDFPGRHQMASFTHLMISEAKWAELSERRKKEIVENSCKAQTYQEFAESESAQFGAMAELQKKGVTLHTWSPEILKAFEDKWGEVVAEQKAKSPEFAKIWASYSAYREGYKVWRERGYLK